MSKQQPVDQRARQESSFKFVSGKKDNTFNQSTQLYNSSFGSFPSTQRKGQVYDANVNILMDQKTTPLKEQLRSSNQFKLNQRVSQTSRHRQILLKLDDSQQKLVVAQKKYGQLWRKYEAANQQNRNLNKVISELQSKNFDLQIKSKISVNDKDEIQEKCRILSVQNQTLKDNWNHATNKIKRLQKNLSDSQQLINQLSQQSKSKSSIISQLQQQLLKNKQTTNQSYQKIIQTLKNEIQSLHQQLSAKPSQYLKLQKSLYSSSSVQNRSQSINLHNEISQLQKEKLALITSYEQKILLLEENHKFQIQKINRQVNDELQQNIVQRVQIKLEKEERQIQRLTQATKTNKVVQQLARQNRDLVRKVQILQLAKNDLETQLFQQRQKTPVNHTPQYPSQQNHQIRHLFHELQSIKKQLPILQRQLQQKQKSIEQQKQKNTFLIQQVTCLQEQVHKRDMQILQSSKLSTKSNQLLLMKISVLQQQTQQFQRQTLAQRLENMKLKQEIQEQAIELKRQYQLSLENVKTELSQQIKSVKDQKIVQVTEKEKIYIQMKQLEKKYQLLLSEMITVDDMMTIATKVHKRHSQFVKKPVKTKN